MSNNSHLNILDLPNEILLIIFNELNMVDVLYSFVDINVRFNRLILDPLYIRHLDLTINSSSNGISSIDNLVLDRICKTILPQIHHQVNKLTVESHSMECVLLSLDYPQLYSLSLVGFQEETFFQHFTGIKITRLLDIN